MSQTLQNVRIGGFVPPFFLCPLPPNACSIIRREEGELGSWGAHLAIDHASKENLRNRHFWPGRVYARPWNFRKHNFLDAPREGDSRPNLAAESPPAGPPGEARPQNN